MNECNIHFQNCDGDTALIKAAFSGHIEVCEALINAGSHLDVHNKKGLTALLTAAKHHRIPCVVALIKAGCDHSLKDRDGNTAMDNLQRAYKRSVLAWIRSLLGCEPRQIMEVQVSLI
jgi:ankyrin repeat protein